MLQLLQLNFFFRLDNVEREGVIDNKTAFRENSRFLVPLGRKLRLDRADETNNV